MRARAFMPLLALTLPRYGENVTATFQGRSERPTGQKRNEPMSEVIGTETAAAETVAEESGAEAQVQQEQGGTFTQADLDKYAAKIRAEERRKATEKFADYDDVKSKAEGAKTLEERLGLLEGELTATKQSALRTSIAAKFGISTEPAKAGEPSDADLFLTGSDESTLTAQAQRLVGREADRKKQGNVAPKEGATTTTGTDDGDLREFARGLFGQSD
jgi:hypothetical protein